MNNTEQGRATRAAETAARSAAGLNLADNNPLSGRGDSSQKIYPEQMSQWTTAFTTQITYQTLRHHSH